MRVEPRRSVHAPRREPAGCRTRNSDGLAQQCPRSRRRQRTRCTAPNRSSTTRWLCRTRTSGRLSGSHAPRGCRPRTSLPATERVAQVDPYPAAAAPHSRPGRGSGSRREVDPCYPAAKAATSAPRATGARAPGPEPRRQAGSSATRPSSGAQRRAVAQPRRLAQRFRPPPRTAPAASLFPGGAAGAPDARPAVSAGARVGEALTTAADPIAAPQSAAPRSPRARGARDRRGLRSRSLCGAGSAPYAPVVPR